MTVIQRDQRNGDNDGKNQEYENHGPLVSHVVPLFSFCFYYQAKIKNPMLHLVDSTGHAHEVDRAWAMTHSHFIRSLCELNPDSTVIPIVASKDVADLLVNYMTRYRDQVPGRKKRRARSGLKAFKSRLRFEEEDYEMLSSVHLISLMDLAHFLDMPELEELCAAFVGTYLITADPIYLHKFNAFAC